MEKIFAFGKLQIYYCCADIWSNYEYDVHFQSYITYTGDPMDRSVEIVSYIIYIHTYIFNHYQTAFLCLFISLCWNYFAVIKFEIEYKSMLFIGNAFPQSYYCKILTVVFYI